MSDRLSPGKYYKLLVETAKNNGFPAIHETMGNCAYRADDGKKCVIGLLIPDELYSSNMEGKSVRHIPVRILDIITPIGLTLDDLIYTQNVHDLFNGKRPNDFIKKLNELQWVKLLVPEQERAGDA